MRSVYEPSPESGPVLPAPPELPFAARLRVLSSGSEGNCALLEWVEYGESRRCLIDAGLSPRRTVRLLDECGCNLSGIPDVLLTHLDGDHAHRGWARARAGPMRLHVHRRHAAYARAHWPGLDVRPFEDAVDLGPVAYARTILMSHDDRGTVAFRFDFACGASLGYATDLGRATPGLIDLFRGVDVLALESNYCPRLQAVSGRPEHLKRRITSGAGHLSNEQSALAVAAIGPRFHVVLLHLSRDCNNPQRAAAAHAAARCPVTIAQSHAPTEWIAVPRGSGRPAVRIPQPSLFASSMTTIPS